jgi:hypothetical protein
LKKIILILGQIIFYLGFQTSLSAQTYSVVQTGYEYQMMLDEFHFLSLLNENGIHAYRPHPGSDINGWGSTWYAQPFLPNATLGHSVIDSLIADSNGINCYAHGMVSDSTIFTYGIWNMSMHFQYSVELKKISGSGSYQIYLDDTLYKNTGDLNLFKIASNYLFNVPLLCDTINGETGDMESVEFNGNSYSNPVSWIPTDSNLFVWDYADTLSVDVEGCYNNIDTEAQGYNPIEPAFKPGIKVSLNSLEPGQEMIVGGIYNFELGQDFWEDNVGITPLILASSQQTEFYFTVDFESEVYVDQTTAPEVLPEFPQFADSLEVSIICETEDAEIYYTLNGTNPTIGSTHYSCPFYIDTTTIVKAKAYKCELETSDYAVKEYEMQNQVIIHFPTNQNFNIYPNPFTESFRIESINPYSDCYKISILDITGIMIYQTKIIFPGDKSYKEINSSSFNTGLYIIIIDDGVDLIFKRIVKVK